MIKYGSPEYWKLSLTEKEAIRGRSVTTPLTALPAQIGVAAALRLARMGAARPVTKPVTVAPPEEKKGFVDWLTRTPLWTPFKSIPTPPVTPPVTPLTECPQGLMYDKPLMFGCDVGYIPYDPGIGQKELCMCTARYKEAMGILKPIEQDKTARDVGLGGLAGIVDMLPTLIVGGIIIAAMGMLKK